MSNNVIEFDKVGKQYILGSIGTGTLSQDLKMQIMMLHVMRSNRINWIDWAKSICMFLVILGHCHIKDSQIFIVQYIYSFHMPLFFMLSGMLCKSSLSLTSLKKDIRFLLIPYIVYGSMLILFHSVTSHTYDFFYLYTNILVLLKGYDASVGPIWFLFALFFIKQFFYCCKAILKR